MLNDPRIWGTHLKRREVVMILACEIPDYPAWDPRCLIGKLQNCAISNFFMGSHLGFQNPGCLIEKRQHCGILNFFWDPTWDSRRDSIPKSHIGIPPNIPPRIPGGIPGGIPTKILHGKYCTEGIRSRNCEESLLAFAVKKKGNPSAKLFCLVSKLEVVVTVH